MIRRAITLGLCLALAGCGLLGPRTNGPDGLSVYDGDLRNLVRQGRIEDALDLAETDGDAAGDDLLATLNLATVEHYAGRFEGSNDHLLTADVEIDERYTKSVSRAAVSLITNDRVLAWMPSHLERLMIHVYGALNYVALGELDEAAVEARLLSQLLDEMREREPENIDRDVFRTLSYFAGAVFETAGEWNDADVSYRHSGFEGEVMPSPDQDGSDLGEVVVLIESGFVANRVEQSVNLLIDADDADYLRHGSNRARHRAASCLSRQRLAFAYESFGASLDTDDCPPRRPPRQRRKRDDEDKEGEEDDQVAYLLRVAWPVMHRSVNALPVGSVRAYVASSSTQAPVRDAGAATMVSHEGEDLLTADLSSAVIREFNSRAPGILIKALARAAVKYTVVHALADDSEAAQVIGNAVTALLERADTRSWTLLPSDMHIVRLQLPVGTHRVVVELDAGRFGTPPLVLDDVRVHADRVTVVSARAWP
ncbi:MAG: hypothetical protein E4H28_02760 [Gemmatimonadales bacterium]|nr:MAG: hypothetical protein E4H28_02760 [Gemmatimonadales bacterium]